MEEALVVSAAAVGAEGVAANVQIGFAHNPVVLFRISAIAKIASSATSQKETLLTFQLVSAAIYLN